MAQQRESKWKNKLRDAFYRRYGGSLGSKTPDARMLCIEGSSGQQKGLPDRYFATRGVHAWVEVKCDKRKIEPLQRLQLWRLAQSGQNVLLLRVNTLQEALYVYRIPFDLPTEAEVCEKVLQERQQFRVHLSADAFAEGLKSNSFWRWFWGKV